MTLYELDGLEEGLPVGDLVGDSGEDLLERQRLLVQLLEGLLGAAGLVLCICKGRRNEGRKEKVQWISGVTTRNSFWSLAAPPRRGWSGKRRYRLGAATKVNDARTGGVRASAKVQDFPQSILVQKRIRKK